MMNNNAPTYSVALTPPFPYTTLFRSTGVSESGATQPCAASALQTVDCTFDLANGATKTRSVEYSFDLKAQFPIVCNLAPDTASGQPIDATGSDTVDITRSVSLATTQT